MSETAELVVQIATLKAENQRLIEREARRNKSKNGLQNIPYPNPEEFVSAEGIAELLVKNSVLKKADLLEARSFLKLFTMTALAQSKPVGVKGRGKLLYVTDEVMRAIACVKGFATPNQ